jgi:hypothetical protein
VTEAAKPEDPRHLTEQQRRELVELMSRGKWHVFGSRRRIKVS